MGHVLMDYDLIDWTRPIMFTDGRFCRYYGKRTGTDHWVEYWDGSGWDKVVFSERGSQIRYTHERAFPRITCQPWVDMARPLIWLDTGERAFVREVHSDPQAIGSSIIGWSVDDPTGQLWMVLPGGRVQGLPPRVLANMTSEQLQAEGRVQIKRAQEKRRREREQAALEQLADLNPELFGAF